MSAAHTPGRKRPEPMTGKEAAREVFVAGYHKALDDVAEYLAIQPNDGFLAALRMKAAVVKGRAAIAKATGSEA
ncbi:MAG: hypothetical protein IBJ17_01365 [Reyranella sp.]|nr:hypothetical protein [Reyranella sp.]